LSPISRGKKSGIIHRIYAKALEFFRIQTSQRSRQASIRSYKKYKEGSEAFKFNLFEKNWLNSTGKIFLRLAVQNYSLIFFYKEVIDFETGYENELESVQILDSAFVGKTGEVHHHYQSEKENMHPSMILTITRAQNFETAFKEQILTAKRTYGADSSDVQVQLNHKFVCKNPQEPLMIHIERVTGLRTANIPLSFQPNGAGDTYQLESVLLIGGGHATCLNRDETGSFIHFDDHRVNRLTDEEAKNLMSRKASLLFYKKV
jgi:hypothetical protein